MGYSVERRGYPNLTNSVLTGTNTSVNGLMTDLINDLTRLDPVNPQEVIFKVISSNWTPDDGGTVTLEPTLNVDPWMTGPELLQDGEFIGDISNLLSAAWTLGNDWLDEEGVLKKSPSTSTSDSSHNIVLVPGSNYVVSFEIQNYDGGTVAPIVGGTVGTTVNANGTYSETIQAGTEGTAATFSADAFFRADITNISVTLEGDATELLINTWTLGDGWSENAGTLTKAIGTVTSDAVQGPLLTNGATYTLNFTIENYMSGRLFTSVGDTAGDTITANGTYSIEIVSGAGANVALQAGPTFQGDVKDISLVRQGFNPAWNIGAEWSIGADSATKTAGSATELSQDVTITGSTLYNVTYTIEEITGGTLTPIIGGTAGTAVGEIGTYSEVIVAGTGGAPEFVLSADAQFAGTVKHVSFKEANNLSALNPIYDQDMLNGIKQGLPWRLRIAWNDERINVFCAHPMQLPEDGSVSIVHVPGTPDGELNKSGILGRDVIGEDDNPEANSFFFRPPGVPEGATPESVPMNYRVTTTDHGIAFMLWEDDTDIVDNRFSWFCIQRPVSTNNGDIKTSGKSPVFCVYSIDGGHALRGDPRHNFHRFVVRERDILMPSPLKSAVNDSPDSNRIINQENQLAIKEKDQFVITFPNRLTTQRYMYFEELDMIGFTSADVIAHGSDVTFNVYNEREADQQEVFTVRTVSDDAGSLAGTYMVIKTVNVEYYVWIDVDNTSTDPIPPGMSAIEVNVNANDTADDIAFQVQQAIDLVPDLDATVINDVVTITTVDSGDVRDSFDVNTGFQVTTLQQGKIALDRTYRAMRSNGKNQTGVRMMFQTTGNGIDIDRKGLPVISG